MSSISTLWATDIGPYILTVYPSSYVLFSISNVSSLLEESFASCWKDYEVCDKNWIAAVNYLEVAGIIVGQILVGFLGDWLVYTLHLCFIWEILTIIK